MAIDNRTNPAPLAPQQAKTAAPGAPAQGTDGAAAIQQAARRRRPMSIPQRRLETPDLPGHHLHWFVDRNIQRALDAGYTFVSESELPVNQRSVGTDSTVSGNASLGSQIQVVSGPEKLTLMKIKEEWYNEDQQLIAEANMKVVRAIFTQEQMLTEQGLKPRDPNSYVKVSDFTLSQTAAPRQPLLNRGVRKQV